MKKNELLPTEENLINTLTKDAIGRNKDIEYFLNILKCQESSCALALNGRWGTGKTFFVRQTEMYINASNFQSKMSDEKKNIIKNALTIKDIPMTHLQYIMMLGKMIMIQIQFFLLFAR